MAIFMRYKFLQANLLQLPYKNTLIFTDGPLDPPAKANFAGDTRLIVSLAIFYKR